MGKPDCPDCQALLRMVAQLEARVRDLEARLRSNASNSPTPPSANPLGAPKPVLKKKSRRRPGAQPGHPPHLKQLLPAGRVQQAVAFVPRQGRQCQAPLPARAGPDDPPPSRHPVVDLPRVGAQVTEYQGQARTCPGCGAVTHAPIPRELLAHSAGPRLTATLSYLTGCHGLSKRGVEEIAADVFDAPIALGTVANLEQELSAALAAPHQQAVAAVQAAAVKHADESSWKLRGRLCRPWGAATAGVAVFVIHARRSAAGLAAWLGEAIQGILGSDRWGVYNQVPAERRQVCWAHLKRDFQRIVDGGGADVSPGRRGRRLVKEVFAAGHAFQEGRVTRAHLQARLDPVADRMQRLLLEGALWGEDPKVAAFCEKVLAIEPALWTFVRAEGVEPTNTFMERLLRRAVRWRKRSFGCWSAAGCRFVQRMLTVVQTRRRQGRNVLDYLHDALQAHHTGQPCPELISAG